MGRGSEREILVVRIKFSSIVVISVSLSPPFVNNILAIQSHNKKLRFVRSQKLTSDKDSHTIKETSIIQSILFRILFNWLIELYEWFVDGDQYFCDTSEG